ncbi:outer membrane protein [Oceanibacterium hippocampi]|uniref:outer membrane protein n=1 Tax=Oceanibacterium hippocampi TaxID=745714 RepID=UPI001592B2F8|nr:outer membrane beta-barrel protein [Oceanibacterium hippocampi]
MAVTFFGAGVEASDRSYDFGYFLDPNYRGGETSRLQAAEIAAPSAYQPAAPMAIAPITDNRSYGFERFFNEPHPFAGNGYQAGGAQPPARLGLAATGTDYGASQVPNRQPVLRTTVTPDSAIYRTAASTAPLDVAENSAAASSARPHASAGDDSFFDGFYVGFGIFGSYAWVDNVEVSGSTDVNRVHDQDEVAGNTISVGYSWAASGTPIRAELEGGIRYRYDRDLRADLPGVGTVEYKDNLATVYALANVYYDFDLGDGWRPFLGAGMGFARHWSDSTRRVTPGTTLVSEDTYKTDFIWTVGAGINYNWSENWGVGLNVRYIDLGSPENGPYVNGDKVTSDYASIDILLSLLYSF